MKNNIVISKFLLPTSVIMMIVGFILLVIKSSNNVPNFLGLIALLLVIFGFFLFVISLIERSLISKRDINNNEEKMDKSSSVSWSRLGIIVIIIIVVTAYLAIRAFNNAWSSG